MHSLAIKPDFLLKSAVKLNYNKQKNVMQIALAYRHGTEVRELALI